MPCHGPTTLGRSCTFSQSADAKGVVEISSHELARDVTGQRIDEVRVVVQPGEAVDQALANVQLDGRIQSVELDTRWVVDVAHNPDAAEALARGLQGFDGRTVAIIGMLDDKDVETVAKHLDARVDHWIAVAADSPRAINAAELARRVATGTGDECEVAESLQAAMQRAEALAGPRDRVLVTGSFYLVGPALDELYSRRKS